MSVSDAPSKQKETVNIISVVVGAAVAGYVERRDGSRVGCGGGCV